MKLTEEELEKFRRRETISKDDESAICTRIGWANWQKYKNEQLRKIKS